MNKSQNGVMQSGVEMYHTNINYLVGDGNVDAQ